MLELLQDHFKDNFKDDFRTTKHNFTQLGTTQPQLVAFLFLDFVFGTMINQSQHRMSRLKSDSVRIFVALWLFSILIISVGLFVTNVVVNNIIGFHCRYSGGLMSVLTIPLSSTPINTIPELAQYHLPVAGFGDTVYKLAKQSLDPDIQKITEDYIMHYDYAQAVENASNSKVVLAESRGFLEYTIR